MLSRTYLKLVAILATGIILLLVSNGIARAQDPGQGAEQALGTHGVIGVRGAMASVWTAQQAASNTFRASPVGVCTDTPPCTFGGFVETGYYKGVRTNNGLRQYATWHQQVNQGFDKQYGLGGDNLLDNHWYEFSVHFNTSTSRWVIKRDGVQVFIIDRTLPDFPSGDMVACGAEGGENDINIAVQCDNMQYRKNGSWFLYNWTFAQTTEGYCVQKQREFNAIAWGPGC